MLLVVSTAYGFTGATGEMGLAIVAGAIGLAFANLDKISKFKGAGFEAEMNMVHTLIDNQTEPSPEIQAEAKKEDGLSAIEDKILTSLQKPGYTWRYAKTVGREVELPTTKTESLLNSMMQRGLAKNGDGTNGEIWSITALGRSVKERYASNSQEKTPTSETTLKKTPSSR